MKPNMTAAVLAASLALAAGPLLAEGVTHHLAVHVDQGDPHVMNMALNNVENVIAYYESQGDTVEVELVAYGPGVTMFVEGVSRWRSGSRPCRWGWTTSRSRPATTR